MSDQQIEPQMPMANKEVIFPASLDIVNAAVYQVLSVWNNGRDLRPEQTPGAIKYIVSMPSGTVALFLLHRAPDVTSIAAHPFLEDVEPYSLYGRARIPTLLFPDEISLPLHPFWQDVNRIFVTCFEMVYHAVRCHHPYASKQELLPVAPPIPHYQRDGWHHVFAWHLLYVPEMSLQELADTQGVEYSTLRNRRMEVPFIQQLSAIDKQMRSIKQKRSKSSDKK